MHLKSLVLKGFKSFADRSVLGFEPGITAVVGPNGSGKSNISDSVLWVLGERSAKNLRGQNMEDVIFSGSSARKSVGIAEVDLVLDNSDGTLPIEYDEVAITRRMYRNGESEYLINGAIARRMDVLDILHDTGLGTGTNSIISQGSLDMILQSKPEDRRALIEEAAGVLKHKQRKLRSERKLEQMDNHLTRVRDIATEVERQLKPLERKAKRAQSYQGLAAELSELSLKIAVDDLRILQGKWKITSDQEAGLSEELEKARELIKLAENSMAELQEQIQAQSSSASEVARQYRRAQSALERFDSARLLLQEKKRISLSYETDIRLNLDTNKEKLIQAQGKNKQLKAQLEETCAQRASAEEAADSLQSEQASQLSMRSSLEKSITDFSETERKLTQEIETIRATQAEDLEKISSSKVHEKLLAERSFDLQNKLEEAEIALKQASLNYEKQETLLNELREKEKKAREASASSFSQREKTREAFEVLQEKSFMVAAKAKGLEEQLRSTLSANEAYDWVLDNKTELNTPIESLTKEVSIPKELEKLVESLLGTDLNALCVVDNESAVKLAEDLSSQKKSGDIVLLPQKDIKANTLEKPAVGASLLASLEYPAALRPALEALLGDVYLCESMAEAVKAHKKCGSAYRFATAEGFVLWGNGKMTLFLGTQDENSELARQRQIRDLNDELAQLEIALTQALNDKEAANSELQKAQAESLKLSQELASTEGNFGVVLQEKSRLEDNRNSLKEELTALKEQREEALEILSLAEPKSQESNARLQELAASLEAMKARSISAQNDAIPLRERIKEKDEELSKARLKVATLTERENYERRMLATNDQEIRSFTVGDQVSRETLIKKLVAKDRAEVLLGLLGALSDSVGTWTGKLETVTSSEEDTTAGLHFAITDARNKARSAHDVFDKKNEELSQTKVEKGRLEIQVETAVNTIVQDCKTPLEQALESPELEDRATTEDQAFKLRRRIANMGTINPDAAAEYEILKKRFDYMSAQLDDMTAARRALAKIIRVIDARMKDAFADTFEQVRLNFQEIFAVLFPGGSAELKLVDPENMETTGIEVTAQPRGKRITKMMLLSGGEKSLTALALLFAIYRIRSTPFYILDEVEAALDDINLRRICAYFDSLRETTQLILITHQRRTMETADVLYGVSMQADGVSKVVSQKLERALLSAED